MEFSLSGCSLHSSCPESQHPSRSRSPAMRLRVGGTCQIMSSPSDFVFVRLRFLGTAGVGATGAVAVETRNSSCPKRRFLALVFSSTNVVSIPKRRSLSVSGARVVAGMEGRGRWT